MIGDHGAMLKPLATLLFVILALPAAGQGFANNGMALPVHGNWCGLNHGGGPILDALDDSCFRHDFCTFEHGRNDCGCDLAFMTELRSRPWPNPGLAEKARAVYEAIAMTPCTDPQGQREKMSLAAGDWAAGVISGREMPWDIIDRMSRLVAEGMARAY